MVLLEREPALSALTEAMAAALGGSGRVVVVSGDAGLGKTALVTTFVAGLEATAHVLWGRCDDLSVPRPLGPLRDALPELESALSAGTSPADLRAHLITKLAAPTVLVLEDVHWADDASVDVIAMLGRRIDSLPVLLVLTLRDGDLKPDHPLRVALGGLRAPMSTFVDLAPLSPEAVAMLAGPGSDSVHAVTGGNPFFVSELLAARPAAGLPPSIARAVLGRAARLEADARRLLELVSVVPTRTSTGLLDMLIPSWPSAAEQPERRGLLQIGAAHVSFRHELARQAIRSSLTGARRRELHGEILGALLAVDADPADVVHHGEEAGDQEVVAEYALVAGRRAAALDSNSEAFAHLARAAELAGPLQNNDRAALELDLAQAAYAVGRLPAAFAAVGRAAILYRELGDVAAVGRCTRILSRYHWYAGDGASARATAHAAIAILEPEGESVELARAYSGLSQLAMLSDDDEGAIAWGDRALTLATRLGDNRTRAHALVNIGSVRIGFDPGESATLLEAHAIADAAGDSHEATRALQNLAYHCMWWVRPEPAQRYARAAVEYARKHEVHTLASYSAVIVAWLQLRAGDWVEAERGARAELGTGLTVPALLAETVLAELAVRRGDVDAADRLARLADRTMGTGELQRTTPILQLEAEWALTQGGLAPVEHFRDVLGTLLAAPGAANSQSALRVAAWARTIGLRMPWSGTGPSPYVAMRNGDWATAAEEFGSVGWNYDRALLLSLLDDERSLLEALAGARRLGATPLAGRAARRLRDLGFAVPRGPRPTTRAHPAGLTARQRQVYELMAGGLTNAEIAERLVIAPKTVEHHVSAVLNKMRMIRRQDAITSNARRRRQDHGHL